MEVVLHYTSHKFNLLLAIMRLLQNKTKLLAILQQPH